VRKKASGIGLPVHENKIRCLRERPGIAYGGKFGNRELETNREVTIRI